MSNLAILRQKLQEKAAKENRVSGDGSSNYPFWNIPEASTAIVRFLPDADTTNPFFWAQKDTISLTFDGIRGGDPKPLTIKVPSMSTWSEECPVTEAIRPLWQSDRETAKKYYRKKSFNYAAFVVNSPLVEDRVPANPIRRLALNQSIHDVIWAAIMDPEMEEVPTHFDLGRDFKITKTKKGEYANYSTSSFSMKVRSLTENEHAAIKLYGLPKFADYLGRKPDAKELEVIFSMFEDSLAGKPYDVERYGEYFKPWSPQGSVNQNGTSASAPSGELVNHLSTLDLIRSIKR